MDFEEYIKRNRHGYPAFNADISERWNNRMVPNGWHQQGVKGAEAYLKKYGKGIGQEKCLMLARCAEEGGWSEVAGGFYAWAYLISQDKNYVEISTISTVVTYAPTNIEDTPAYKHAHAIFPDDMQPDTVLTMTPVEPERELEFYINDDSYFMQPKFDFFGQKIIIYATPHRVWCCSKTPNLALKLMPTDAMKDALRDTSLQIGSFIVEGHVYGSDVDGAKLVNANLYGCLWHEGFGALMLKDMQVEGVELVTQTLQTKIKDFKFTKTFRTQAEKAKALKRYPSVVFFKQYLMHCTDPDEVEPDGYVKFENLNVKGGE